MNLDSGASGPPMIGRHWSGSWKGREGNDPSSEPLNLVCSGFWLDLLETLDLAGWGYQESRREDSFRLKDDWGNGPCPKATQLSH